MPRSRRYGEHAPPRPGQAHRPPWLRTAQLNIVGWSALLGVCSAAGGVGVLLARALGLSGSFGLVLAPVPLGAVVLADRMRWVGRETGFGWGASVEERDAATVRIALRTRGIDLPDRW